MKTIKTPLTIITLLCFLALVSISYEPNRQVNYEEIENIIREPLNEAFIKGSYYCKTKNLLGKKAIVKARNERRDKVVCDIIQRVVR